MKASLILCVATGCAASTVPAVRFANAPAVTVVDDRRNVPTPPEKRVYLPDLYFYDGTFQRPVTRLLEVPRAQRARGVNALDEVPDSTWFTNRIGARTLTVDEVAAGSTTDNPELHKPWTIRSSKIGGTTLGFIIKDARGVKYMLKFEGPADPPELETGTHVVVSRLLWACGYNVPQDSIAYLRDEDLVLAPDAVVKDREGRSVRAFDRDELRRDLANIRHEPDGRIRALASRWIDGTTLGGHPGEGVRDDDPNDLIPHELRRDLRGQYPIYAWLDAVDVTEGQYVDSWEPDPGDPKHHYVKHYAIDFGKSLGAMGAIGFDWWRGHAYRVDFAQIMRSLLTVGAVPRPWEDREAPQLRGVAKLLESEAFEPGSWHPDTPGYLPFLTADRIDNFWGAKIVARFTREQIHAAVEAARFTDPRAVEYITDTLVKRQRATAAYWFSQVNPLDHFVTAASPSGVELCFDDLAIKNGLASASVTQYSISGADFSARSLGTPMSVVATRDGVVCSHPALARGDDNGGYTILRISTARPGFAGETFVHVARDPSSGVPRVIGIWRP